MIFDGDCRFCQRQVLRWRRVTGDRVFYIPYQSIIVDREYLGVSRQEFESSIQLLESKRKHRRQGADAVLHALACGDRIWRGFATLYDRCPAFASASELLYRVVARARGVLL
ncbi:thiol-disulfide oxidoreductase DCC family protein [Candidatus Xiphinematobacter sp. Idaho Grape]|uniref:thiol-disulfide oxidoreductase DCC family protein n=1 Tax=Candidatus Xiphinematobacter sp. Idaho Grape TaxID=1704307 RepID=UPI00130E62BB|nr:DCC1-like thiol-disulfide oxidoreductase family protein [Candidatus Xiphinematobacter sp. Idaho Grape]